MKKLDKKLVLEAFADEQPSVPADPDLVLDIPAEELANPDPELTEQEKELFHSSVISDLLTKELETFTYIKSVLADPDGQLDELARAVLESVSEDTATAIGKLEHCLNDVVDNKSEELINQAEDDILDTKEKE